MPQLTAPSPLVVSLKPEPALARWLPTDAWVRLLLVPALAFIALAGNTAYLADFWHHLARGRLIVSEGRLLDHDIFTYTVPGQTFQDVNWLSQVAYFLLYDQGGLALVRVFNALLVAVTLGLLVLLCRRLSGSLIAAMVIGIAAFLGLWQVLTIRPQTFSMLLFVILFDILLRSERRPWLLLAPPLLLGLWANLHGAFPAGIILTGCFAVAEAGSAWRRGRLLCEPRCLHLVSCLTACVLATLANPYGWQIYQYVGLTSSRAAARGIDEWRLPRLDQGIGVAFFLSLLALGILLALNWKRQSYRPSFRAIVFALCFLPLAASSVRMVVWWLLVMAPTAAILLARLMPAPQAAETKPTLGASLTCAILLLLALSSVPGLHAYNPLLAYRSTERVEHDLNAILERLRQEKAAWRIFTRFEWGEFITWADRRFSVFMDGRIEIYPDKVWQQYEAVTIGRDWSRIVDDYKVNALILDSDYHARTGLLAQVASSAKWTQAFQAGSALLYLRMHAGKPALAQSDAQNGSGD